MDIETQESYSAYDEDTSGGTDDARNSSLLHTATAASSTKKVVSSHPVIELPTATTTAEAGHEEEALPLQTDDQKEDDAQTQQTHQPKEYSISFFPRDHAGWVRTLMTSMLGLLLVGLVLSLIVMPQYALVILFFWLVIMSAFSGLVCILQAELQRKDYGRGGGRSAGYVFHPILHAMAQAVVDEMEALQDEWRQEILLIKAADESSSPYSSVDKNGEPVVATASSSSTSQRHHVPFPRTKKRSKLFRIFVKPFLRGGRNSNSSSNSKTKRNSNSSSSKSFPVAGTVPVSGGDDGGGRGVYVAPPVSALV
jgi:hypothetical protein